MPHRIYKDSAPLARQQARVDALGEEITQLKSAIQHAQDSARDEDELKDLLAAINETPDAQQRVALTQSYNSLKRALERQREYARQGGRTQPRTPTATRNGAAHGTSEVG